MNGGVRGEKSAAEVPMRKQKSARCRQSGGWPLQDFLSLVQPSQAVVCIEVRGDRNDVSPGDYPAGFGRGAKRHQSWGKRRRRTGAVGEKGQFTGRGDILHTGYLLIPVISQRDWFYEGWRGRFSPVAFSTIAAGGANCEILLNRRSDLPYLRFGHRPTAPQLARDEVQTAGAGPGPGYLDGQRHLAADVKQTFSQQIRCVNHNSCALTPSIGP